MRKIWNFMRFNIFALINEVWNFVRSFPFANIILLILIWTDRFAYWLIGRRLWRKFGGLMLFTFIFWQLAVAKSSFYEIEFEKTFILIPKESRWSENRENPKLFPIFFESISNFRWKSSGYPEKINPDPRDFEIFEIFHSGFSRDFFGISKSQSRSPGFRDFWDFALGIF